MTSSAALLILTAALLHALWNMYSRKFRVTSSAFCIGGLSLSLALFLASGLVTDALPILTFEYLAIIAFSSVFQALYFIGVVNAYACGHLSLSYPLLRSIPILLVLIYTLLAGDISAISAVAVGGGLLIILGCTLLPMASARDFKLSNYTGRMMGFVMLAAFGTAGYSVVDSWGMQQLANGSPQASMVAVSMTYVCIQVFCTSLLLGMFSLSRSSYRQEFLETICKHKLRSISVSLMTMLAYAPVLAAMTMVTNVSYVVALRQVSIPIAFLLGILVLQESSYRVRWFAVLIISLGLVLSALN